MNNYTDYIKNGGTDEVLAEDVETSGLIRLAKAGEVYEFTVSDPDAEKAYAIICLVVEPLKLYRFFDTALEAEHISVLHGLND